MCDPVSIGTSIVGALASAALAPRAPQAPQAPQVAAAPQAQASKTPDQAQMRRNAAAAAEGGARAAPTSTQLTSTGGVAPGALNLGKNVLLGS